MRADKYINDAQNGSTMAGLLESAFAGMGGVYSQYPTATYNTYEATRQTVEIMRRLTIGAGKFENVQRLAVFLASRTPPALTQNDEERLVCNLWDWVTENVKLVEDERLIEQGVDGRELLIAPEVLLSMRNAQGDCDDFSMLTASILKLWGYAVKFVTSAADVLHPNMYSHVWVRVRLKTTGEWVDMDCSHGPWLGWNVVTALSRPDVSLLVTEWAI